MFQLQPTAVIRQFHAPSTSFAYVGCLRSTSAPLGLRGPSLSHTVHFGGVSLPAGGLNRRRPKKSLAGSLCASQREALEEKPPQGGREIPVFQKSLGLIVGSLFFLTSGTLVASATELKADSISLNVSTELLLKISLGVAAGVVSFGAWFGNTLFSKIDESNYKLDGKIDGFDKKLDGFGKKLDENNATVHRLEVNTLKDQAALESRVNGNVFLAMWGKYPPTHSSCEPSSSPNSQQPQGGDSSAGSAGISGSNA